MEMKMGWIKDKLTIRNDEIEIKRGKINHLNLKYYKDNPRIYSVIRPDEKDPEEAEIEHRLQSMEHVKALLQDIKANGGLFDPIIVREGTWEVLEGNSRLAAYRKLYNSDPIRWGEMDCVLLPQNIKESQVFALLGQYHIIGKKDWAPFEQAGFLYRRNVVHKIPTEQIAIELGLKKGEIKILVQTYKFMVEHKDTNVNRWSYYYEFIKSRKLSSLRKSIPSFDRLIVSKIKKGEIEKAIDVRDKLQKLKNAKPNVLKKFIDEKVDLNRTVEIIDASGSTDSTYQRLHRFRIWLLDREVRKHILSTDDIAHSKIKFEIIKINKDSNRLISRLEKSK
jgi:hypothetical protein